MLRYKHLTTFRGQLVITGASLQLIKQELKARASGEFRCVRFRSPAKGSCQPLRLTEGSLEITPLTIKTILQVALSGPDALNLYQAFH